ncbi:MAG TPA: SbcC/MukB-like Walker B domain-containing protein, partial [Treponemataceae bacterium]|nr:SbcC/MukB-like Walker B domain-containing protein [Treponemataceae bacterium]
RERELAGRLTALEADAGRIDGIRAQIDRARRAAPLAVKLAAIDESAARAESGRTEIARLDGEIAAELAVLDGIEAQKNRLSDLAGEKDGLLLSRERLRVAVGIAESLEAELAAYETTKKALAAAKTKKAELEGEREKLAGRLAALEAERSAYDARNEESARARDALEAARQIKALSDEYGAERKSRDAHAGAIGLIAGDIELARRDADIAKAELEAIEREAEGARTARAAADLAVKLEPGKPCPVCGSLDHPAPAQSHALAGFTDAERIDAGKRRLETLAARIAALEKTQAARAADLANADARLDALEKKLSILVAQTARGDKAIPGDYTAPGDSAHSGAGGDTSTVCASGTRMPSPEEAAESVRALAKAAQVAQDALARARSAWREAEEIARRAAEVSADMEKSGKSLLELERAAAEQKAETAQKKARFREAFPSGDGSGDPADALERCESRILEIEADMSAHESRLTESRARSHVLSGKRDALTVSLAETAEALAKDEAALARDLEKAGFSGRDAAREAAIPEGERAKLERAVAEADAALAETRGLLADVRKELSGWDGPEPESVVAELDGINAALAGADGELEARSGALAELEALNARHDALEAERAERSIAAGRMGALANDLTGANPLKTGFDAWILGMYLEEITAYANSRLERMSEGRYRIQLNDSYRKGNAYAGLELEILDAYTGKARPSATLSGGETFMASISLALGLADSIQSRSGGIQLDAVFIDEGFGSLDESSLERAIGILDEIRGSRMVGIVSHVVELRSRIPNRIEVVKTVAGSSIRKELNTQGEI